MHCLSHSPMDLHSAPGHVRAGASGVGGRGARAPSSAPEAGHSFHSSELERAGTRVSRTLSRLNNSMHRFRVQTLPESLASVEMSSETSRQIARVLRLRAGEVIALLDGTGRE